MKKTKIAAGLLALVLSASVTLSIPAYAEESVDAGTIQAEITMPANIDPTLDGEALITDALENLKEDSKVWYDLNKYILESGYTFGDVYLRYNINTNELYPEQYIIYAQKDGEYVKCIYVSVKEGDYGIGAEGVDDYEKELLESGKTMWHGTAKYTTHYNLIYTVEDGFYSTNFRSSIEDIARQSGIPMDFTWGNFPSIPTNNGEVLEDEPPVTTEPITTTPPNVSEVNNTYYGDINLDGAIDLLDAVLSSKAVSGAVQLNEQQLLTADCDANGILDANDTVVLLQFLVHKVDTLPWQG